MNDLLKSQIHENCKLALPEGIKELMSDISREVLRAQPPDLYQFIADYLGAMLEAREALTIACQVCADICQCTFDPIERELYSELRKIGLEEEDIEIAIEVIIKHLKGNRDANESVKGQSLLQQLLRKTNINDSQVSSIQEAIQKAFKRQKIHHGDLMNFQNNKGELAFEAAHHTLQSHKQKQPASAVQNEGEELFVAPDFRPYDEETKNHVSNFEELIEEIEEINGISDDFNDEIQDRQCSDDEIQEFIEDIGSENESSASSVADLLQNKVIIDS